MTETDKPLSADYQTALALHNRALADFNLKRIAYVKREIGDDEFIAARRAYDKANAAFDKAFAKEAKW